MNVESRDMRTRRRSIAGFSAALGAAALALCAPAHSAPERSAGPDPAAALDAVRSSDARIGAPAEARNVEVELGRGRLTLEEGRLYPVESAASRRDGAPLELVFVGRARFRLDPPDEIEAGQLQLFTGRPSLDTRVDRAVLVLSDAEAVRRLLERPAPAPQPAGSPADAPPATGGRARAREVHRAWLSSTERRHSGVEPAMFLHRVGDPLYRRFFAVWMRSTELGEFLYQLDPEDEEELTLAAFTSVDVTGWDRRRLARHLRLQQRKGRWLGVRVEDLGAWDVWMSADAGPPGRPSPDRRAAFEIRHYDLDVRLERGSLELTGVARLFLEARGSGRLAARLQLFRDLQVEEVRDARDRPLFFFRSGNEIVVHLPEPTADGERAELQVRYRGHVLESAGRGVWDLKDTVLWYPHAGAVDRATYNVKLAWPRKYGLVGGGHVVAEGIESGYRWARMRLDRPAIAHSFVLGELRRRARTVGEARVEIAFARRDGRWPADDAMDAVSDAIAASLRSSGERFGTYPLESLRVAVLPRRYSQSFLGYMTLSDSVLDDAADRDGELLDLTIAHEIAHQWWGNLVGWDGYRDQWLSEAIANYAALDELARATGDRAGLPSRLSAGWRDSLARRTADGRPVESLGPVVLGERLNNSVAVNGYRPIVYRKGAAILAMLARTVGPDRFVQMLGELAAAADDRVLTTESFLAAIERMSGLELDGFAERFVYSTGIPQVYYEWDAAPRAEGGWTLHGRARVLAEPRWTFDVLPADDGSWEVARRALPSGLGPGAAIAVPYRVRVDDPAAADGRAALDGQWMVEGRDDVLSVDLERRPVDLRLDPAGEVFARFHARDREPKRVAWFSGLDAVARGDLAAAERHLDEALAAPATAGARRGGPDGDAGAGAGARAGAGGGIADAGPDADANLLDARIRLARARLFLATGRPEAAAAELAAVDASPDGGRSFFRMERDALAARLELRAGDAEAAHRRLRKTLRLASPRHGPASWRALVRQLQLRSERDAMTEAWALLAVASWRVREAEDFRWAVDEARSRGVDLGPLVERAAGWTSGTAEAAILSR